MATSPAVLNPAIDLRRAALRSWLPVLYSIAFICFTSTTLMSGYHTQFVVDDVWHMLFGNWHLDWRGTVNLDGRKIGHFFGYGVVGLIFRQAWHQTLRVRAIRLGRTLRTSRLFMLSAVLSVQSVFLVASLDELHQSFLPQRVGSFGDVLRDTAGTIFLNLVLLAWRAYRHPAAAYVWSTSRYSDQLRYASE